MVHKMARRSMVAAHGRAHEQRHHRLRQVLAHARHSADACGTLTDSLADEEMCGWVDAPRGGLVFVFVLARLVMLACLLVCLRVNRKVVNDAKTDDYTTRPVCLYRKERSVTSTTTTSYTYLLPAKLRLGCYLFIQASS
eukprot:GHVU01210684.1.p1 GENE.GHVU01210684.1~~GHVU01210684.1.p1  ORF type:complete len:139 (-),score=10.21 GHVU01210684.1:757-1173(-)